ncbi:hypothetical protein MSP8887_00071 [Marinomonas spartinae]|uniref:hypothetical protein n=1 Tax=Marinomonas spartinae TaxID=1792290 RepID=UPI000808A5C7|nr:hypothetical protein [Marinomonas spartinae]SBS24902.1 hypothetical protein MSP8887_00071 [Marinomonas spartinae]
MDSHEEIIFSMIQKLSLKEIKNSNVIDVAAPIISFGDFSKSKVATLGLNPSDKEFFSSSGDELYGVNRRFHTLRSLCLDDWKNVNEDMLKDIKNTCLNYFRLNPYDRWFKPLDYIVSGSGFSYYDEFFSACHLDIFPYATHIKWGDVPEKEKSNLISIGSEFLSEIINNSEIEVIILNGKSVVLNFEKISGYQLESTEISSWRLPRKKNDVKGISYTGNIDKIGNIKLHRNIKLLGFNHNIQSSFGVTNNVKKSIRSWIEMELTENECERYKFI